MKMLKAYVVIAVLSLTLLSVKSQAGALATSGNGTQQFEVGPSTPTGTVLWVAAGAGSLYELRIDSGTIGDYLVAFDSSTNGGSYTGTSEGSASAKRITSIMFATSSTTATSALVNVARKFSNGLKVVVTGNGSTRGSITVSQ